MANNDLVYNAWITARVEESRHFLYLRYVSILSAFAFFDKSLMVMIAIAGFVACSVLRIFLFKLAATYLTSKRNDIETERCENIIKRLEIVDYIIFIAAWVFLIGA